jgi:hypothetical protein
MVSGHSIIALSACLLVSTHADDSAASDKGWCVLNGAAAINDLMDAGVYSWAASQRCNQQALKQGNVVKCEIDIASAAESLNRMVNVIAEAVKKCGKSTDDNSACGMAAGKLTAHLAGAAAASGGVVQECPNPVQKSQHLVMRDSLRKHGGGMPLNDPRWPQGEQATCAIDLANTGDQIFKASQAITEAQRHCGKDGNCAYDALDALSAFAGLGKYLMGALGHCYDGPLKGFPLSCSEHIANLARQTTGFIADTDELVQSCRHTQTMPPITAPPAQLEILKVPVAAVSKLFFNQDKGAGCSGEHCHSMFDSISTTVGALLPVAGVVCFLASVKRYRAIQQRHQYRDMRLTVEPQTAESQIADIVE